MSIKISLTIATCSKSNLLDLLRTCHSVQSFTKLLPSLVFEHLLVLSTYQPLEIDIVRSCLNNYDKHVKVKIIQTPPEGISQAFNTVLQFANGKYIMFLNAGDIIEPDLDCLASIRRIFKESNTKFSLRLSPVYYFDVITTGKSKLFSRRVKLPQRLTPYSFLKMGNPINHQSTLYPLKLAQRYPYPNLIIGMDYSVNLAMVLDHVDFRKLSGFLVTYDITGTSAKYPFLRLKESFKVFVTTTVEHGLFILLLFSLIMLPLLTVKTTLQKITYPLR